MAERRMFSKRVIGSARFLRMPGSTQAIYFHLGMAADDDGIVEAYPIMQMVNASEDDLRLLAAKGFVKVLNEDLVTYILDWQENNKIRADRKVNSIYKDLLLQVMPETPLIEPRQRADRVRPDIVQDNHGTQTGQPRDANGTSHGQPMDNHGTQMGPHRIGKDRIVYAAAANARTRDDPQDKDGPDHGAVFRAFSDNIHPITGEIERDRIIDLTDEYGPLWMTSAIEEAALSNGRSLRYITAILERWKRDGFKAERKKGGTQHGINSGQEHMAGDGAEKSAYAAYLDGDTVKRGSDDLGSTPPEERDSADDWSTERGDPQRTSASLGSRGGADQTSA
jgi:DnaD/phage-associated family protein|nr:MAG TPA: Replication initiation and membrane attachment [Caudoviricetes sp.]